MTMRQYVDTALICKRFRVSERTVRRWRKDFGLPFKRLGPRLIRYDVAEVTRWIDRMGLSVLNDPDFIDTNRPGAPVRDLPRSAAEAMRRKLQARHEELGIELEQ